MCNAKEKFHLERTAFAIVNKDILFMSNSKMGHKEWLVDGCILTESEFNSVTRGIIKDNKIYFYTGDFKTTQQVEEDALKYTKHICKCFEMPIPSTVYCGMKKGEIGTLWEPLKAIEIQ